jgi:hypothetical protein
VRREALADGRDVLARLALALSSTAAAIAVALAVQAEAATPVWAFHRRSPAFETFSLLLAVALVALALLPSRVVAVAAGPLAGGLVANVVSAGLHGGRVPNPFVAGEVAFDLADVFVLVGVVALTLGLARLAVQRRTWIDERIPPRRWERRLRQRLGL